MRSRIVLFERAGEPLRFMESTVPSLTEGQVLVRNEYATLCRSDLSTFLGKRIEKSPTILGHETVGRIIAFGPGPRPCDACGRPLSEGQRVTWTIYAADPDIEMARRGIPQKASDLFKYGHEQWTENCTLHGGLADYTILRRHTVILPLSEDIPLPAAALVNCALSTVAGSLRLAGPLKGRKVAIWGVGMLGVAACAMCREAGAARVTAIDVDPQRLDTARRFGATHTLTAETSDVSRIQADVAIDYSGAGTAMESTVQSLATGGTAVWVGGVCPQEPVRIDAEQVVRRLSTIKGLHNYNADDFRAAVGFLTANWHKYPFHELIYDGFTLDCAAEAFSYAVTHNPFRMGLRIQPSSSNI